jgi:hypothetical protein
MTIKSEIDETLRRLGSVEPPSGLEQRVQLRLQNQTPRFSLSVTRTVAAGALAASVALSAAALNPGLRNMLLHHNSGNNGTQNLAPVSAPGVFPRAVAPGASGFGAASAVHVPAEPVAVQPTPVTQGRGRARSGRSVLPSGALAPLPRGVAPHAPTTPPQ